MRRVVENPDEAQLKATLAKKYIQDHYSPDVVATIMKKRLSDIYTHIKG